MSARTYLSRLLDLLDIKRVIVVDDQFLMNAANFIAAFPVEEAPTLRSLSEVPEGTTYEDHIVAAWDQVEPDDKIQARVQADKREDYVAPDPTGLRELIGDRDFRGLTMHEWESEKEKLLRGNTRSLILFDVNFEEETGDPEDETGLGLAAAALAAGDAIVGLLTNRADVGQEEAQASDWARQAAIQPAELVVVNKLLLDDPDDDERLNQGVEQVRETLQAAQLTKVRRTVRQALADGISHVDERISNDSPTLLEDVVFMASHDGGEWEGDTWFRLYSTLGLERARRQVATSAEVRAAITDVRQLLQEKTGQAHAGSERLAIEVEQAEAYDPAEYVNGAGLPIANGDIFRAGGGGPIYILVGQPCDLALRPTGRDYAPSWVTLLPVKEADQRLAEGISEVAGDGLVAPQRSAYQLPPGGPFGSGEWEVRFRPEEAGALDLLDLCSFNTEGKATTKVRASTSLSPLLPGLQKRAEQIQVVEEKAKELVGKVDDLLAAKQLLKAVGTNLRERILGLGGPFAPTLNGKPAGYDFHCERIGRLSGSYADALLAAHSNARSRTVHAHELTRIVAAEK